MKKPKSRLPLKIKKGQLFGLFVFIFIALCLISETVLAILNEFVNKGHQLAYTIPLYTMPFVAGLFTFLLVYSVRRKSMKV